MSMFWKNKAYDTIVFGAKILSSSVNHTNYSITFEQKHSDKQIPISKNQFGTSEEE